MTRPHALTGDTPELETSQYALLVLEEGTENESWHMVMWAESMQAYEKAVTFHGRLQYEDMRRVVHMLNT